MRTKTRELRRESNLRFQISDFRFQLSHCRSRIWRPVAVLMLHAAAIAAPEDARPHIDRAQESMAAKQYDQAQQAYEEAAKSMPDSPELSYDQGVAFYRKGRFDKAADMFTRALTTKNRGLEAKAKFNLGNCAYQSALAKEKQDPKSATDLLRLATSHYRDAIEADPHDTDARANIELAQRLIRKLEEEQKQKEQQNQQDQKDQKDKKDDKKQPQSQPSSQPQSSQDKKDDKQQQNKQDSKDQKGQSGQKDDQKSGADQKGGEQKDQSKQGSEKDSKDQQGKLESGQKGDAKDKDKDKDGQQAQMVPTTQRALTKEEAEKLLQLIRDKEKQRAVLLQQMRQKQAKMAPVEKDW